MNCETRVRTLRVGPVLRGERPRRKGVTRLTYPCVPLHSWVQVPREENLVRDHEPWGLGVRVCRDTGDPPGDTWNRNVNYI